MQMSASLVGSLQILASMCPPHNTGLASLPQPVHTLLGPLLNCNAFTAIVSSQISITTCIGKVAHLETDLPCYEL